MTVNNDMLDLANDIKAIKETVRQAIENKGVSCDTSVPFNKYPNKISQVAQDVLWVKNDLGNTVSDIDTKIWIVPFDNTSSEYAHFYTTTQFNDYKNLILLPVNGYECLLVNTSTSTTASYYGYDTSYSYDKNTGAFTKVIQPSDTTLTVSGLNSKFVQIDDSNFVFLSGASSGSTTQRITNFTGYNKTVSSMKYLINNIYLYNLQSTKQYVQSGTVIRECSIDSSGNLIQGEILGTVTNTYFNTNTNTGDYNNYYFSKQHKWLAYWSDNNYTDSYWIWRPNAANEYSYTTYSRTNFYTNRLSCLGITNDEKYLILNGKIITLNPENGCMKNVFEEFDTSGTYTWYQQKQILFIVRENIIHMYRYSSDSGFVEVDLDLANYIPANSQSIGINYDETMISFLDTSNELWILQLESINDSPFKYKAIPFLQKNFIKTAFTGILTGNKNVENNTIETFTTIPPEYKAEVTVETEDDNVEIIAE